MFSRLLFLCFISFSLLVCPLFAVAKPDMTIKTGKTVADTGAEGYRFVRLTLSREDTIQHRQIDYRVNLAIPTAPAPDEGFPLLIMLDGNAALMEVNADLLAQVSERAGPPPVLAFLAHDNDLRIDGDARAWDYTPAVSDAQLSQREKRPGRSYGGADQYLAFITHDVVSAISQQTQINMQKRGLWGHSYGGLFVLHALFTQPEGLAFYAPVDPSLWWGEGYILKEEKSAANILNSTKSKSLFVVTGSGGDKNRAHKDRNDPALAAIYKAREAVPGDEISRLVERVNANNVNAKHITLPGLSHGATLGASLPEVFAAFSEFTRSNN